MNAIRRILTLLAACLVLGGSGALAQQEGSPGMDEIAADVDEESGTSAAAEQALTEYRDRVDEHGRRLDDHEQRLRKIEGEERPDSVQE